MFYLFLDFDGVTHPASASGRYFRSENIKPIEQAILGLDPRIVISSTWRLDKSLCEIKELLGDIIGSCVIGITPELDDPFVHSPRHKEVEIYLEKNGITNMPWVAVDDTPAFYKKDAPLLLTDPTKGFVENDIEKFRNLVRTLSMTTKEAVLQRLIYLRLAHNRSDAERWLITEQIPAFGAKTAAQLILEGDVDALLEEIERVANDGYA